jgi:hypothetical protein
MVSICSALSSSAVVSVEPGVFFVVSGWGAEARGTKEQVCFVQKVAIAKDGRLEGEHGEAASPATSNEGREGSRGELMMIVCNIEC